MFKQFKEFAFKGNLVDMAVGFILGAGFATLIKSLVANVIMPVLGLLMAGIDFSKMKYVLEAAKVDAAGKVTSPEVAIKYGLVVTEAITFIMLAFVVFIIVKKVLEGKKKEEEKAPAKPSEEVVLLSEIRDALKK